MRGNGREAGYGNVTASLYPTALGAHDFAGAADPEFAYEHTVDGTPRPGLPPEVAALVRVDGATAHLKLVNRADPPAEVTVTPLRGGDTAAQHLTLAAGQTQELALRTLADLSV